MRMDQCLLLSNFFFERIPYKKYLKQVLLQIIFKSTNCFINNRFIRTVIKIDEKLAQNFLK